MFERVNSLCELCTNNHDAPINPGYCSEFYVHLFIYFLPPERLQQHSFDSFRTRQDRRLACRRSSLSLQMLRRKANGMRSDLFSLCLFSLYSLSLSFTLFVSFALFLFLSFSLFLFSVFHCLSLSSPLLSLSSLLFSLPLRLSITDCAVS